MVDHRFAVTAIETFLPPNTLSSDDLVRDFGFSKKFLEEKVGVKTLHIATHHTVTDMAAIALERVFASFPFLRAELDVLVVCTQTGESTLPHISAILHGRCGLDPKTATFDIGLGCSGFVHGISILKAFLASNQMSYGILVTVDKYSGIIDSADRNTKCLFSDAAAATLVSRSGEFEICSSRYGTYGHMSDRLALKTANQHTKLKEVLFMDGRSIYNFALETVPNEVRLICEANGVRLHDVDYFIFHQASKFVLESIEGALNLKGSGKVVKHIEFVGNTVSSSIPFALKDRLSDPVSPRFLVLVGFGVGLTWASTILK